MLGLFRPLIYENSQIDRQLPNHKNDRSCPTCKLHSQLALDLQVVSAFFQLFLQPWNPNFKPCVAIL